VIWQCGKLYFEDYKKYNSTNVQVVAFIERMDFVYAAAELFLAQVLHLFRSCVLWVNQYFIPSQCCEDHQTKNAKAIVDKKVL
jgi:UDP-N-acetylglucosamine--N-acetylmuramyl-(pentapeptide) pyrophosphoryl-undecaprenol N-acetylglucosamine transferase